MKKSINKILSFVIVFVVTSSLSYLVSVLTDKTPLGELKVHFVDVGQGDCEIIQLSDGRNIIIDGGSNSNERKLIEKILALDIDRFDYVIATHPHEDHIGGLDEVIRYFDVGCVYMPDKVSNTKAFEELLDVIEDKNVTVKRAKAGEALIKHRRVRLVLVAPTEDRYADTNNYSAVARLTFGDCNFLFTGDAESVSEKLILKSRAKIKADVLKVGHHGSSTSTTKDFFEKIQPRYAVIEVGVNNKYGHPHTETLQTLSETEIYRTDIHGDITMVCDGKDIKITTEKGMEND